LLNSRSSVLEVGLGMWVYFKIIKNVVQKEPHFLVRFIYLLF